VKGLTGDDGAYQAARCCLAVSGAENETIWRSRVQQGAEIRRKEEGMMRLYHTGKLPRHIRIRRELCSIKSSDATNL